MKRLIPIILSILFATNIFAQTVDDLSDYNEPPSRFRGVIEKFSEDYGSLNRFYTAQTSPNRGRKISTAFCGLGGGFESVSV